MRKSSPSDCTSPEAPNVRDEGEGDKVGKESTRERKHKWQEPTTSFSSWQRSRQTIRVVLGQSVGSNERARRMVQRHSSAPHFVQQHMAVRDANEPLAETQRRELRAPLLHSAVFAKIPQRDGAQKVMRKIVRCNERDPCQAGATMH